VNLPGGNVPRVFLWQVAIPRRQPQSVTVVCSPGGQGRHRLSLDHFPNRFEQAENQLGEINRKIKVKEIHRKTKMLSPPSVPSRAHTWPAAAVASHGGTQRFVCPRFEQ
jgi:hypothetical protein